jgi:DNA invertase Pin-like site-specific DNA recombinase
MSVQPYPTPERLTAIGYRRASTTEQQASGLGLDAQTTAIEAACVQRGWTLLGFEEDIASGGRKDRPGLARALGAIAERSADCVVVSRLDRLGRSVAHVATLLERYPDSIVALDVGLTPDSPAGRFTLHVVSAAAELERGLIRERTRDALRAARERGVQLGRPREMSEEALARIAELHRAGYRVKQIADALNEEGIPTPRGGRWHSPGVKRALGWLEAA